jgi:hypothetical protein
MYAFCGDSSIASAQQKALAKRWKPTEKILDNKFKLKTTISMDRPEYFPGELFELTITVENRSAKALTIPKPFEYSTGKLGYFELKSYAAGPGAQYEPLGPEPYRLDWSEPPIPTITIRPGEVIVRHMQSYDGGFAYDFRWTDGVAPRRPGDFQLAYWGGAAKFRVIIPTYEGVIRILYPAWDGRQSESAERTVTRTQKHLYAFVLGTAGKHFLCLTMIPYAQEIRPIGTDSAGNLIYQDFELSRYTRVAETDSPIVSLRGETDAAGHVHLSWGAEGERRLVVDRSGSMPDSRGAAK